MLEAIRLVHPNYEAEICEDIEDDDVSPLVKSLYTTDKTNLDCKSNVSESMVREVKRSFEEQLEQEKVGFGTIRSVEKKKGEAKDGEDSHKNFSEIQSGWKKRLTAALEREIELVIAGNKGRVSTLVFC